MKFSIVLNPFPFDDFQSEKVRPALCLTQPISIYRHLVLAAITSNLHNALEESDLILRRSLPEFNQTGLKKESVIKLHRLITIRQIHIKRVIGELHPIYQTAVLNKLNSLFSS
jgi:mRNA interferase MazF